MEQMDRETILAIEKEFRQLKADPNSLNNSDLQAKILKSWEMDSPQMWARLQRAGMAEKLAFVVQQRMWAEKARLIKSGMPVTDAREAAERENLMLQPESTNQDQ